ncbi:hypothetical protein GCM10019016_105090 [Streptomyces prasinosporus]|uniref:Secreted protein n=1 Tax=Streptomyces prasinosporus TaxID=68256 RepID=A0ABP6U7H9_9ACTN
METALRHPVRSVFKTLIRSAAVSALVLLPPTAPAPAAGEPGAVRAGIACRSAYACICPEIDFGGQPRVRRASDGSVKGLPSAIRDRGGSTRDNSNLTARVHEKRNHSGRWVCVTRRMASRCVA